MEKIVFHQLTKATTFTQVFRISWNSTVMTILHKLRPYQQGQALPTENSKLFALSPGVNTSQPKPATARVPFIHFMRNSVRVNSMDRSELFLETKAMKTSFCFELIFPNYWVKCLPTVSTLWQAHTTSFSNGCSFSCKNPASQRPQDLSKYSMKGESKSGKGLQDISQKGGFNMMEMDLFVESVIEAASVKDKMILSIPHKRVKLVVNTLLTPGMSLEQVKELLLKKPGLLKEKKLQQFLSLLRNFDFDSFDVFEVLKGFENVSDLRPSRMKNVFDILRTAGVEDRRLKELIVKEPAILGLDGNSIETRISKLKTFFKTDDVMWLMVKTPVILTCDWAEVKEKFEYVSKEMNISQRQIMYSQLFVHPIDHVKCRHQFLILAGLYSMDTQARSSNPRLQDILDIDDTVFVRRFGGMHVDEYRTFCKLMAKPELNDVSEELH